MSAPRLPHAKQTNRLNIREPDIIPPAVATDRLRRLPLIPQPQGWANKKCHRLQPSSLPAGPQPHYPLIFDRATSSTDDEHDTEYVSAAWPSSLVKGNRLAPAVFF
jgi:hypothetical protein